MRGKHDHVQAIVVDAHLGTAQTVPFRSQVEHDSIDGARES